MATLSAISQFVIYYNAQKFGKIHLLQIGIIQNDRYDQNDRIMSSVCEDVYVYQSLTWIEYCSTLLLYICMCHECRVFDVAYDYCGRSPLSADERWV